MLGMLAGSGLLPFPGERILEVILAGGLPAFAELNREAFRLGHAAASETRPA